MVGYGICIQCESEKVVCAQKRQRFISRWDLSLFHGLPRSILQQSASIVNRQGAALSDASAAAIASTVPMAGEESPSAVNSPGVTATSPTPAVEVTSCTCDTWDLHARNNELEQNSRCPELFLHTAERGERGECAKSED